MLKIILRDNLANSLITEEAKKVWESLIKSGRAESYDENGKERFRFIS